ncbi:MAG: hypothetical protein M3Y40_04200 [Chloroflexota bacterium]|nr:hypothetical protein [Chloroflexota bacterium]
MVEYALILAHSGLLSLQTVARSAELWLSRVNWEIVGYVGLGLIALRIAVWAFRPR